MAQAAGAPRCPDKQRQATCEQQRRRPRLEMLDALDPLQNDEDLNRPKQKKTNPGVKRNVQNGCVAEQVRPTCRHYAEQRIDRRAADPGLNSKPAASDYRSQDGWNICALRAKSCATENRKGDAIF